MTAAQTSRWIAAQSTALAVVLLAALVAALTLQSPAPVAADTLRLVDAASSAAAEAGSYRMEMEVSAESSGVEVDVDGRFDLAADGSARGEMELPGSGTIRFLSTGGRGWFELPEGARVRAGGKRWVGFPVPEGGAEVTQDPLDVLRLLSGAGEVLDMGADEVRGVDTRHYRAELDAEALAGLVQEQQAGLVTADQIRQLGGTGRLELWLDGDDLPRRVRAVFEAERMTMTMAFELFEYGVDIDVTPPPADQVLEVGSHQEAGPLLGGG